MNAIPFPALPPLPTMGVGSMAAPGWFIASWRAARKGEWGAHDIDELFEDATRIVVADQLETGVDIVSDGELRRQRSPVHGQQVVLLQLQLDGYAAQVLEKPDVEQRRLEAAVIGTGAER